jgi:hypothetical protein
MRVRQLYIYIYIYIWCWWGNLREGDNVEGPRVDMSVILKIDIKYIGLEIVYWIDLAQGRGKWPAALKTVLMFGVP